LFGTRKKSPPATIVPGLAPGRFDPLETFPENFQIAGTVVLDRCPVCDSGDIGRLWQLPQTRLGAATYLNSPGSPFHDFYLDYLPLLKVPQSIFVFDMCRCCHAIFRNPKDDDQTSYRNDTSKVESFKKQGTAPFLGISKTCEKHFPRKTQVVVDAACGAGQVLSVLRQRHPELKLIGLELSQPSVDFIRSCGIEAATADLDYDELDLMVPPGSADFVVFYEAFEHVRRPLTVLHKLVRMLRPGGRLHFTAQYYGPESELQIRVGEPIYIDRHGLDWIVAQLDADLHDLQVDVKLRVTLQRRR
jgi:SAM-dependent methyltransferase